MATRPATTRRRAELYADAVALIERAYGEDLDLVRVARRIGTSRRQLQRAFAETGDTTFRDSLVRVRVQRASRLLAATDLPVREIARRVGYRQPAQFAKTFRRHLGVSPSEYRRAR